MEKQEGGFSNRNLIILFGIIISLSVFFYVAYPIYKDSQKEKVVEGCAEFRGVFFSDQWKRVCKDEGYSDGKCNLTNAQLDNLLKASDTQEEYCIKGKYPLGN